MVSRPSRRHVREPVERCCSCTRHSTCSTAGLSARVCECQNAGRKCTGCYYWGQCKNQGRLMPSPTTVRGLLGHFLRGADPPATNQRASTPPVRSPTYSSLRAISAAGARGRGARGGASSCRSLRDGGGGGAGSGRKNRNREGRTSGKPGAETRPTVTTMETTAQAGERRGQGHHVRSVGAGEEYRSGRAVEGESADKSAGWSGADSEGSNTDEEATTAEGAG